MMLVYTHLSLNIENEEPCPLQLRMFLYAYIPSGYSKQYVVLKN